MDEARFNYALTGLRRFGNDEAIRSAEHLEIAVELSQRRPTRWTELMSYSIRESLEGIPPLFGQERLKAAIGALARRFADEIADAVAIDSPPDVLIRLTSEFQEQLDVAQAQRRYRIAQAMLMQAGAGMPSPRVDDFAKDWTSVVEGVNGILHGGSHTQREALGLLDKAIDLMAVLVGPISDRLEEVDKHIEEANPTAANVEQLLDLLADERLARYFFERAENPAWLQALNQEGIFDSPMQGDWYQGQLLIRASAHEPVLGLEIATRIAGDPHPAAPAVVLGVVANLGEGTSALAVQVLGKPSYSDPFRVSHALDSLIKKLIERGETATLSQLADAAFEPRSMDTTRRVTGKFGEYEYGELVRLVVSGCQCEHLGSLLIVLGFKLRRIITLTGGGRIGLSIRRDLINGDDNYDRSIEDALISGIRDTLSRMSGCGASLAMRQSALGDIDSEILVRLWANHLAEEEQT